jgi:hypothetical protein
MMKVNARPERRRRKQVLLEIWCNAKTRDRFKLLCVKGKFRNYEAFLEWLLAKAEAEWIAERIY